MTFKVQIHATLETIPKDAWNELITDPDASPFIRYEYLEAMEKSGCVGSKTGWTPCHFTVWQDHQLLSAMPNYIKTHSYGEYVFDWAWANAYSENGLSYYPKMLCAIPFTPVGGNRLLGNNPAAKEILLQSVLQFTQEENFSSVHILFPPESDESLLKKNGFLRRESIQFHWQNQSLDRPGDVLQNFEEFLYTLNKKRRNNIVRERESVREAGLEFIHISGTQMTSQDWDGFYECYASNYFNHGNAPYLNREFFGMIGESMAQYIHLIFALENNEKIAASLIFRNRGSLERAYGRYWGATKYIKNLHFETAYYQNIDFCIREKIRVFEGGAQGEHKIHRGLLPVNLYSMHYLVDDRFYNAVNHFLAREGQSMHQYINELEDHHPIKQVPTY
jgi:predicted N-acyltransferase